MRANPRYLLLAASVMTGLSQGSLASVTIYGGVAYDSGVASGYTDPRYSSRPFAAGNGVGVASAKLLVSGVNKGYRPFRWDSTGQVVPLNILGTDNNGVANANATAVNAGGVTVGEAPRYSGNTNLGTRAVRWDSGTAIPVELDPLGFSATGVGDSTPSSINASGVVVGSSSKYVAGTWVGTRAVRWDANGTAVTPLNPLNTDSQGYTECRAWAISDTGNVVGSAYQYDSGAFRGTRAVRWDAGSTSATELGTLGVRAGATDSEALAVNDSGVAVGYALKVGVSTYLGERAVRWAAATTTATELEALGADSGGNTNSRALDISSSGAAVGYATKYVGGVPKGQRAVRWNSGSASAVELGLLGTSASGTAATLATSINDAGLAVGSAQEFDSSGAFVENRAVVWGTDAVPVVLNSLLDTNSGWVNLASANTISNSNWITGIGSYDPDGTGSLPAYNRAFLLQLPVPEPGSLCSALILCTLFRRGARRATN